MKVYIVMGNVSFEFDEVLKVFHSKKDAEDWVQNHCTGGKAMYSNYDEFTIEEHEVE